MTFESPEVCLENHRRSEIRARGRNGIDYVEISDDLRVLTLFLLRRAPEDITAQNVVITCNAGSSPVKVTALEFCWNDELAGQDCIRIFVDRPGDHSEYKLKLVELSKTGDVTNESFHGFDPKYSTLRFRFRAAMPTGLDCVQETVCDTPATSAIEINYLARDFTSFRQLVLDRLALIMPDWTERHIADEGIALVEILAYVADYLSYYQDAVATEAYLATARQRISVRRHVRLLDYSMHEGCNARTWAQIQTSQDVSEFATDRNSLLLLSGFEGRSGIGTVLSTSDLDTATGNPYLIFQAAATTSISLRQAHNRILFYTWGEQECHLPQGATAATLEDAWLPPAKTKSDSAEHKKRARSLNLQVGDYLLFQEAVSPLTGVAADADPLRRWVVRLILVRASLDPLNEFPIVEIEWNRADALPFSLCLSTRGPAPHCEYIKHVSTASGNLLLVDQGSWISNELLGVVPLAASAHTCKGNHWPSDISIQPGSFAPSLQFASLAYRTEPNANGPASSALKQDVRTALPEIELQSIAPLEDGYGPIFSLEEFHTPALLAGRLTRQPLDTASQLFSERLPRATLQLLRQFDPAKPIVPELGAALASEMAKFIRAWTPRLDLLNSPADARDFVVEMDDNRIAHLRFGDGLLGISPQAGESFWASYRITAGSAANVSRGTISHLVFLQNPIASLNLTVDNPLAAQGGTDPEPVDEVKLFAPGTFLNQLNRAITADDYAQLAQRNPLVQRAAATLVWTGSRYEAQVVIDPLGTDGPDPELLRQVEEYLYPFRRIGHDVRVLQAQYVPLDLELAVQVAPGYLSAHVKRALLDTLGRRRLPNGVTGFFHPDNLTFGQSIYASQIVSAAQALDGVESVVIQRLLRLFDEEHDGLIDRVLSIGPLEVAQLDNEAAHPERGRLTLNMRGGR